MSAKAEAMGRRAIQSVGRIINNIVLIILLMLLAFAGYALWDSRQLYQAADKSSYTVYKPSAADGGKSFQELRALNPEVFAWLTVYGTNIDYPVTQGPDNMKYVNTSAEGLYSLSGAIFLDYNNSRDFSDFNSILYGHHMANKVMFGQIGDFADRDMFDAHPYGNLYFDGKDHGIEFFAFVHTSAYDWPVFTANVSGENRQAYLDDLLAKAVYQRDIGITAGDRVVLLSTCSSGSTNGRDILVGRITDEVFEDPFSGARAHSGGEWFGVDSPIDFLARLLALIPQSIPTRIWIYEHLLIVLLLNIYLIRRQSKRKQNRGQ